VKWILYGLGFLVAVLLLFFAMRQAAYRTIAGGLPGPRTPRSRRRQRPGRGRASSDRGQLTDIIEELKSAAKDSDSDVGSLSRCDSLLGRIRQLESRLELLRNGAKGAAIHEEIQRRSQVAQDLREELEAIRPQLAEQESLTSYAREFNRALEAELNSETLSGLKTLRDELEDARLRLETSKGDKAAGQLLEKVNAAIAELEELMRPKPGPGAPARRKPPVPHENAPTLEPQMSDVTCDRPDPPRGSAEMPTTLTDRVHFSVTAPREVAPGAAFVLDIWAHLEQQRAEVLERARQHVSGGPILIQEKGPVRIARGTILTVRVQVEGLVIKDPEDTILWEGDIGSANFPVRVPKDALPGPRAGTARFYVNAIEVAKLHFALSVGKTIAEPETLSARIKRYRLAFASYASEDNDEVLNILQGIKMGMPDLDVFYAEASLRAGERWPERLKQEILARDVFYLFWSRAASVSPWVDMEWRFAYEKRGIDVIKPVPLVPPHVVPPPPELAAKLHFNDWVLAHKRQVAGAHS
jgi:TIR domain